MWQNADPMGERKRQEFGTLPEFQSFEDLLKLNHQNIMAVNPTSEMVEFLIPFDGQPSNLEELTSHYSELQRQKVKQSLINPTETSWGLMLDPNRTDTFYDIEQFPNNFEGSKRFLYFLMTPMK